MPSNKLKSTDWALLTARVACGFIFMMHGSQKVFGAFEGPGLEKVVADLGPVGYLVAFGEFLGGIGLIVGFLSRFSAAALIVVMIGAIVKVHGPKGFFLSDGGYEYNLALIGLLLPILIAGPGKIALSHSVRALRFGGL